MEFVIMDEYFGAVGRRPKKVPVVQHLRDTSQMMFVGLKPQPLRRWRVPPGQTHGSVPARRLPFIVNRFCYVTSCRGEGTPTYGRFLPSNFQYISSDISAKTTRNPRSKQASCSTGSFNVNAPQVIPASASSATGVLSIRGASTW